MANDPEIPYTAAMIRNQISCSDVVERMINFHDELVLCIDLETTGLDIHHDEILQVCITDARSGAILIDAYVRPTWMLSWYPVEKVHGISPSMVQGCEELREIMPMLTSLLNAASIIVGYNHIQYDLTLLMSQGVVVNPWKAQFCDVMLEYEPIAQAIDGLDKWRSLAECCSHYGITNEGAHNAAADCRRTVSCMYKIANDQLLGL